MNLFKYFVLIPLLFCMQTVYQMHLKLRIRGCNNIIIMSLQYVITHLNFWSGKSVIVCFFFKMYNMGSGWGCWEASLVFFFFFCGKRNPLHHWVKSLTAADVTNSFHKIFKQRFQSSSFLAPAELDFPVSLFCTELISCLNCHNCLLPKLSFHDKFVSICSCVDIDSLRMPL